MSSHLYLLVPVCYCCNVGARLWCREGGRGGGRSRTFYKHMHTFVTTWCQHAIAVMLVLDVGEPDFRAGRGRR